MVDVYQSDDVYRELVKTEVISYWKEFLDQFAALLQGRRSIDPAPLDQRFIAWLEGALEDSIAHTEDAMAARRRIDTEFRGRLDSWMLAQGWEPSPREEQLRRNLERAARLACYILVTRLVFYQVLRRRFSVMNTLSTAGAESSEQLKAILDARFSEAVTYSRDYETVFVPEEGDLGYEIPFISPTAPRDWERLIDRIDEFDLSTIDFDVIGLMYERLIDPNERRRFGQFYTSPDVVDLINAFCIRDANAEVLDPACGGGTFLVRAYARKRVLCEAQEQQSDHQSVLSQIFGIDIAAFPAQLSTINLAVRQLSDEPNYPRVAKANFFDAQVGMPLNNIPLTGDAIRTVPLEPLDAVVGNPPYIRQEKIGAINKYNYRNLFESEWRGQTRLSGRSDIYAYFFTHAAHLLRPGGYLGFVTSIGWLDTDYGFRLQEFFLRNFRIVAVIESQVEKWFEDARVTILQRETDAERRSDNVVRFIQLRKPLVEVFSKAIGGELREEGEANRQAEIEAVRDLIEGVADEQTTDYWRVKRRSQRKLWEAGTGIGRGPDGNDADARYAGGKWGQYIRGPEIWFDLIDRAGDKMVALRELAQVRFGFKTGVDRFFCVRDVTQYYLDAHTDQEDFQQRWGISREDTRRIRIIRDGVNVEHLVERRFLEPELHSLMEVNRPVVRAKDVSRKVINASVSRARLRGTHFDNYVTYAEREGWHTGSTVAARARTRPWYNLALPRKDARAQMFWPMSQQYRHVIPLNRDSLPANHRLFDVTGKDAKLAECLWAALNSTIVALSNFQFGRFQGIEGALDTEVIDVNMMLVPDVRDATVDATERAVAACRRMSRRRTSRYLYEEFELEDRRELDDTVLEILGFNDPAERAAVRDRLYKAMTEMYEAIREREIIAQRDRRTSSRRANRTALTMAEELWEEHKSALDLLEFPRDFVPTLNDGDRSDLPSGAVEVGMAMMETDGLLRVGTIRVGGNDGEVLDVGSFSRARYVEALSMCHRSGSVRLPGDRVCDDAVSAFDQYREELRNRCTELAAKSTQDTSRQVSIVNALMRKALQWRRTVS